MCESVETTYQVGSQFRCAYERNCRFLSNACLLAFCHGGMCQDAAMRSWFGSYQEFLRMGYFFDTDLGSFDTLEGHLPTIVRAPGVLVPAVSTEQRGCFDTLEGVQVPAELLVPVSSAEQRGSIG